MRIYTRSGDDGTTGLIGPGRVLKCAPRVEAYGGVDELNAALGVARALDRDGWLGEEFERQEVNRLQALSDLARLRKTTLAGVMQDLGLRPPAHE